jgi:hypothetical protein
MIYSFHVLENGNIQDAASLVCDNDAAAIKDTMVWSRGRDVEIREGNRIVGALVGGFVLVRQDLFVQFGLLNAPPISPETIDRECAGSETGDGIVDDENRCEDERMEGSPAAPR